MLKRLLRDRKGISLTEVVVAMTIVLLITGAAISVVISSIKADAAFGNKYRALTACENAAECLRFSKGDGNTLQKALDSAGFKFYTVDADENKNLFDIYDENGMVSRDNCDNYISKSGDQEVTVTVESNNYVVRHNGKTIYTYYVNQASQNNGG